MHKHAVSATLAHLDDAALKPTPPPDNDDALSLPSPWPDGVSALPL
jgi:hypothetical protein